MIESALGAATRLLSTRGERDLIALVVNSRVEVIEETDYDHLDGGTTGHTVRLYVPEPIFYEHVDRRREFETTLRDAIGEVARVPGEHIHDVDIIVDLASVPTDWRAQSGALLSPPSLEVATSDDLRRLWDEGTPRIFLSHKSEYKRETKALKDDLAFFGAAAFVAHDDIEPSRAWREEIERALASMDALVALVTDGFNESPWTNQEIGVAIGRGVPVMSVKIETDPRGFIGAKQALPGAGRNSRTIAMSLAASMGSFPALASAMREGLVRAWERSNDFGTTTRLMDALSEHQTFPPEMVKRLETAFKTNPQIHRLSNIDGRFSTFLKRVRPK